MGETPRMSDHHLARPIDSGALFVGASPDVGASFDPRSDEILRELNVPMDLRIALRSGSLFKHQRFAPGEDVDYLSQAEFFTPRASNELARVMPTLRDLADLPEVKRLNGVLQMTTSYSRRAANAHMHPRGQHIVDVAVAATEIAARNNLDDYSTAVLVTAAYLHDVGHVPFSHAGESALRALGRPICEALGISGPRFHHETYGQWLIANSAIREVLESSNNNILADDVIAVLDGRSPLAAVIDYADREAYLRRDISTTDFSAREKWRLLKVLKSFHDQIEIVTPPGANPLHKSTVLINDSRNGSAVLGYRNKLYTEYNQHPATLLVNAIIQDQTHKLLSSKVVSPQELVAMTDTEVRELMSPEAQQWLQRTHPETGEVMGVENHFKRVTSYPLTALNHLGSSQVTSSDFQDQLRTGMSGVAPCDGVFVTVTAETEKIVTFHERGKADPTTIKEEMPFDKRFVAVFVRKDAGVNYGACEQAADEVLKPLLQPGAKKATAIMGHLTPSLYFTVLGSQQAQGVA